MWTSRTSPPAGVTAWRSVLWCITSFQKPSITPASVPQTAGRTLRWPSAQQ
ncbi:hypothetical protein M9458_010393, partial [Cirrhinus mrigala]